MPRLPRGFELSAYELALLVRALTDEQRCALIDSGWGDYLRAAFDFAMRHLPELRPIWESRLNAVPDGWLESFMLMFWDEAVPLLVANPPELDEPEKGRPAPSGKNTGRRAPRRKSRHRSNQTSPSLGRHKGEVLIEECNKAGRVYFNHPGATDYEIWQRYRQGRTGERGLLSKNMVGHLCVALAEGWLPWTDRGKGHLLVSRISGDFRTSKETLVIPRGKPVS